ncbi:hypothetical protein FHT08_002404 [Xanthomonas campestris]|nr:hypothetical protein [Xanthomonas sp. CFBP 8151]
MPRRLRGLLHRAVDQLGHPRHAAGQAGVPCVQLDGQGRCRLFGLPTRPAVCASLRPSEDMCGASRAQVLITLTALEHATRP